ncbi:MAG: hypothetical protein RIR41_2883 [Pseudomonadota bacterium]|jgi:uncharacterized MAPEG superfamily protein
MPDLGSNEITMLWASALLGTVYLLAAVIPSVLGRGMPWAAGPRDEPAPAIGKLGARLDRAWKNFVETFPLFVAAVLVEAQVPQDSEIAAIGAQLYFWGRVAFLPLYAIGVPFLRTIAWTVALAGIVMVLLGALPGI